jgi:hypothetical protein
MVEANIFVVFLLFKCDKQDVENWLDGDTFLD